MDVLFLILFLAAAVCFLLTAFNQAVRNVNTLALGLFFAVTVPLIKAFQAL